jgi:hypothetical protein
MKRVAALLLTLVIAVTCFSICAYADSDSISGLYNGYNYYCSGTLTSSTLSLEMHYYNNNTAILKFQGSFNYHNTGNGIQTQNIYITGKTAIYGIPTPSNFDHFSSASPRYYIDNHQITSFSLSV